MIYDAALNQTNVGENNNKFYRVQVLVSGASDYQTWTRWGRVGEYGKGATLGNGSLGAAMVAFEKKFKEKAGVTWANRFDAPKGNRQKGYYTFIERKYEDDSDDDDDDDDAEDLPVASSSGASKNGGTVSPVKRADSALPNSVQRLMKLIFNQQYFADTMRELDYDANKLPLGKLSKRTLEKGFEILKDLGELLLEPSVADSKHNMPWVYAIAACSNTFYTVIPHAFGRSRPPVISSEEKLKKEINLMESLSDMQIANDIMKDNGGDVAVNPLDRQFAGLGLQEMTPRKSWSLSYSRLLFHGPWPCITAGFERYHNFMSVTDFCLVEGASKEFTLLQEYLIKSHGHTHHLSFKVPPCPLQPSSRLSPRISRSKTFSALSAMAKRSVSSSRLMQKSKVVTAASSGMALESPITAVYCLKAFVSPLRKFQ